MQDVYDIRELGDIQDPMPHRCVDPNLPDAGAYERHSLPVEWVQSLLDTPKLKAHQSPRVPRKGTNVAAGRTQPLKHLVGHP